MTTNHSYALFHGWTGTGVESGAVAALLMAPPLPPSLREISCGCGFERKELISIIRHSDDPPDDALRL